MFVLTMRLLHRVAGSPVGILSVLCAAATLLSAPAPVSAQAQRVAIDGQVIDAASSMPVVGATVQLTGVGSRVTDQRGGFSFADVPAGSHRLTVQLLGYREHAADLRVRGDTTLTIVLEIDAILLDSIRATARNVDVRGLVREAGTERGIADATVSVRPRDPVTSNLIGRFRLRDLPEGVPALVEIGALGYLPKQFNVLPADGEELDVELVRDPIGQRMIAEQVAKIEDRAKTVTKSTLVLDREDFEKNYGWSLDMVVRAQLGGQARPTCLIIDEVSFERLIAPGETALDLIGHYMTQEIERVEVFGGRMLRVYTRRYIQKMMNGKVPKLGPILLDAPSRLACS